MTRHGFTLIEMLAAIVILTLLAVATVPIWTDIVRQRDGSRRERVAEQALAALDRRMLANLPQEQLQPLPGTDGWWYRLLPVPAEHAVTPPRAVEEESAPDGSTQAPPPLGRWVAVEVLADPTGPVLVSQLRLLGVPATDGPAETAP